MGMSAAAGIPQLLVDVVPNHRQGGPIGFGKRGLGRVQGRAGMNQTTQRASTIVGVVAGLVGLVIGLPACIVADGGTGEGGQGIR